ncbi:ArsR family transcriptional regulator [Providencia sp. PROV230]|uniref:ArsR family transcriptional regulator n=1 Tax=Providencia sp. PROV230 TaxID=2949922 RepID=UPI00300E0B95
MTNRLEMIRQLLRREPATARQLADIMNISQPTISRALTSLGEDIVRIGSGPSIQYTLRDTFRGFDTAPIYRISEEGTLRPLGKLIPVIGCQFWRSSRLISRWRATKILYLYRSWSCTRKIYGAGR